MGATASMSAAVSGLLFGLSLIVAIGAQNTYVLRQGLLRTHIVPVVTICIASDVALIAVGVAGGSVVLQGRPTLLTVVKVCGALFLFGYAALALRRLVRQTAAAVEPGKDRQTLAAAVAACLAFTWLNPGVYLDTVVLLGSVANSHAGRQWWFGTGAMIGSAVWFTALGAGARLLLPLFRSRRAWQVVDVLVAVVMTVSGLRLLL